MDIFIPELPEVELMAQKLQIWCKNRIINDFTVWRVPRGRNRYVIFSDHIQNNQKIENVFRRGKYLVFIFSSGGELLCHNAMSGYWDMDDEPWTFDYVEGKRTASNDDVRVSFLLDNGRILRFHDARMFGSLFSFSPATAKINPSQKNLGPDALKTPRLLPESIVLHSLDHRSSIWDNTNYPVVSKRPIKELLMDQNIIAGIGNIYATEALWRARIRPDRAGQELTKIALCRLTESLREVLNQALMTNLKYDEYLYAYRRKICPRGCGPISKTDIAKRSTYYCPGCQL